MCVAEFLQHFLASMVLIILPYGILQAANVKSLPESRKGFKDWLCQGGWRQLPTPPYFRHTESESSCQSPGIHIGQASALYCLVLWIPMRCLFWSGVLLPLYLPPCWNTWEGTPVGSDGAEHRCSCPFDVWTPEWGSVKIVFREIIYCHYARLFLTENMCAAEHLRIRKLGSFASPCYWASHLFCRAWVHSSYMHTG